MIDVDIALSRGEFRLDATLHADAAALALFGPSGSGKSSLLAAIAGLLRPERGRIVLDGRTLFDDARGINLAPPVRGLGVVFQDSRLFPHLDVRGNLLYGARLRGGVNAAALESTTALLGLGALLHRRVDALSGGETRRVAIGRALLARPAALLLDEPLTGLHREARQDVLAHLARLKRELHVPLLLVSHDAGEVAALADRVALIADGGITAQLDAAEFRRLAARDALAPEALQS
jgi:molybdate transport system ATP-binding protein